MIDINTFLQERYHKDILSLFEAVYNKNTAVIEVRLITIIEDMLRRHPKKPTLEDKTARKDMHALEVLVSHFDQTFLDWLNANHQSYDKEEYKTHDILALCLPSHHAALLKELMVNTLNFLDGQVHYYYEHNQLMQALEEYQSAHHIKVFAAKPFYQKPLNHLTKRDLLEKFDTFFQTQSTQESSDIDLANYLYWFIDTQIRNTHKQTSIIPALPSYIDVAIRCLREEQDTSDVIQFRNQYLAASGTDTIPDLRQSPHTTEQSALIDRIAHLIQEITGDPSLNQTIHAYFNLPYEERKSRYSGVNTSDRTDNDNYLLDITSLLIRGKHGEQIKVRFPSEQYFAYMRSMGIYEDPPGIEEIEEEAENFFTSLGKRDILVTAVNDYLHGMLSLDHLAAIAYRLRSKPTSGKKDIQVEEMLYAASQLAYYERHIEQHGVEHNTFLTLMNTVLTYYHTYKEHASPRSN